MFFLWTSEWCLRFSRQRLNIETSTLSFFMIQTLFYKKRRRKSIKTTFSENKHFLHKKVFVQSAAKLQKYSSRSETTSPILQRLIWEQRRRSLTLRPLCLLDAAPWSVAPKNKNNLPALRHPSVRTVLIQIVPAAASCLHFLFSSTPPASFQCPGGKYSALVFPPRDNRLLPLSLTSTQTQFLGHIHGCPKNTDAPKFLDRFSKTVDVKICRTYLQHFF